MLNKIHFILASVDDKKIIISDIFSILNEFRNKYSLKSNEYYYKKLAVVDDRFDTVEVIFIKRILQRELPEELRNIIVDRLFNKYVFKDEQSFSRELYMNTDQIKSMIKKGMFFGSHGYDHYWLNTLEKEKQINEIELSLGFLRNIGCNIDNWVMCYPYGVYNDSLISVIEERNCQLGLTTEVDIADVKLHNRFLLPRLDTNDLPKNSNAPINEWTIQIMK